MLLIYFTFVLTKQRQNIMTNSKHTPGEWTVHKFGPEGNKQTRIHSNNVTIAKIIQIDESEANAQLIAAAPALLEALQLYMKREKEGWLINLAWREDTHEIIEQAIKKAIG